MFSALILFMLAGCDLTKVTVDTATGTYCVDYDGDGSCQNAYCNEAGSCFQPDCNDADPDSFPGAEEVCDGMDNDCDEGADEDLGGRNVGFDADGDSYADANLPLEWSCTFALDPGTAEVTTEHPADCDDTNANINPGVDEVCDTLDNDCDGDIDEEGELWYLDADNDSYGTMDTVADTCLQPAGYSASPWDCDDTNPSVRPSANELCGDTIDNDCDDDIDEGC